MLIDCGLGREVGQQLAALRRRLGACIETQQFGDGINCFGRLTPLFELPCPRQFAGRLLLQIMQELPGLGLYRTILAVFRDAFQQRDGASIIRSGDGLGGLLVIALHPFWVVQGGQHAPQVLLESASVHVAFERSQDLAIRRRKDDRGIALNSQDLSKRDASLAVQLERNEALVHQAGNSRFLEGGGV